MSEKPITPYCGQPIERECGLKNAAKCYTHGEPAKQRRLQRFLDGLVDGVAKFSLEGEIYSIRVPLSLDQRGEIEMLLKQQTSHEALKPGGARRALQAKIKILAIALRDDAPELDDEAIGEMRLQPGELDKAVAMVRAAAGMT